MQKVLRKRILRDFKENLFRYLALSFLIILSMYAVVSIVGAADTVIVEVAKHAKANQVEDGQFHVFVPLDDATKDKLINQGVSLEEMFYFDSLLEDQSTLRIFKNRKKIDLIELDKGKLAEASNEIVLEKRYAQEHGFFIGDEILVGADHYFITGIGSVPDYDAPLKELSDSAVDSDNFGLGFMSEEGYDALRKKKAGSKAEEYAYAYRRNQKMTDDEVKQTIKEMTISVAQVEDPDFQAYWKENFQIVGEVFNLTQFTVWSENPRSSSISDRLINKYAGLAGGVIIMVLLTYVISVFVIHGIEKESRVIGALYALGVKKKDLLSHYLLMPVAISLISGVIGTVIGYSDLGVQTQLKESYTYFSIPKLTLVYPAYLVLYGIIVPPVAALLVNCIVIHKKLSQPALQLLRNEQKRSKISTFHLGNLGFLRRFQIRQMRREMRTGFTVVFGLFISLLLMILAINSYSGCKNISIENKEDARFAYMYTYKYPEVEVPEGGTACFAKTLKKEIYGYNLDVTVLGIDKENPYFPVTVKKSKNNVTISSSVAQKYNLKVGDPLILKDEEEEIDYAFTVGKITQYSIGLFVFMDINSMRDLFRESANYYNVVFSDHELKIPAGRLYSVLTKSDIEKSSDVFINSIYSMFLLIMICSILIFAIVMYLMLKVMIDRSSYQISLLKVFGYRTNEIKKLYLNGNFLIIAVGTAICIPIAKVVMDKVYPFLTSNLACGLNLTISFKIYAMVYGGILILYFLINQLLVLKLKRVVPAEVVKNRE